MGFEDVREAVCAKQKAAEGGRYDKSLFVDRDGPLDNRARVIDRDRRGPGDSWTIWTPWIAIRWPVFEGLQNAKGAPCAAM